MSVVTFTTAAPNPLLQLSAAKDNAAMNESDLPKAEPPKRKRRWFQFSLRTLMIGVTAFCLAAGWLLSQDGVVWERKALLKKAPVWGADDRDSGLPWRAVCSEIQELD